MPSWQEDPARDGRYRSLPNFLRPNVAKPREARRPCILRSSGYRVYAFVAGLFEDAAISLRAGCLWVASVTTGTNLARLQYWSEQQHHMSHVNSIRHPQRITGRAPCKIPVSGAEICQFATIGTACIHLKSCQEMATTIHRITTHPHIQTAQRCH